MTLFAGGVGQKIPSFTMEDQYAKEIQSSSFKGKHVLLFLADRSGSKLTPNWTKVLEPKYRGKAVFVAVAFSGTKALCGCISGRGIFAEAGQQRIQIVFCPFLSKPHLPHPTISHWK